MKDKKVIMITGATSAIGIATIKEFLNVFPDCFFVLTTRDKNKCMEILNGDSVLSTCNYTIVEVNLGNIDQVEALIEPVINELSRIDILINIAGEFIAKPLIDTTMEDFGRLVTNNLGALFTASKTILPYMINQRYGAIVNISSVLGLKSLPDTSCAVYGAVKAAIIHFTKLLASEVGDYNIRVNCVCPGILNPINTETENTLGAYKKLHDVSFYLENQPLQWFGSPENIAKALVYLSGDSSEWTTGAILNIDGGMGI